MTPRQKTTLDLLEIEKILLMIRVLTVKDLQKLICRELQTPDEKVPE
jgi:hypothetical protein